MKVDKLPVYMNVVDYVVKHHDYGDLLSKDWLVDQFGIAYQPRMTRQQYESAQFEFLTQIEGLKTTLLEKHNIALKCVRGQGYQLIHPKDQAGFAMMTLKEGVAREVKRCHKHLTHINTDYLDADDIKRLDESRGKIAAITAFSRKSLR